MKVTTEPGTALVKHKPEQEPGLPAPTAIGNPEPRVFENEFDLAQMLPTAGKLKLTKDQLAILDAPVNPDDVEIRPDGLIYLPWMEYATRLKKAFGVGGWALVPHGLPAVRNNYMLWGFSLVVQGHYCGYALGEQQYHPTNNKMTWGDACEGAKSNALMRLCKGIGISLELWQPSFIRTWIDECAEKYKVEDKRNGGWKTLWRKKKASPEDRSDEGEDTGKPGDGVVQEDNQPPVGNSAQAPEQPSAQTGTLVDGFMKLRSGPSLIKWVKDNATALAQMSKEDAKKLKAKWDRFQKDNKIDKELSLRTWVEKHADMSLLANKKEEAPAQKPEVQIIDGEATEVVNHEGHEDAGADMVKDTFTGDPGPNPAREFDHLVHEAVKRSQGAKGVTYETFGVFFNEQWASRKDKYPKIELLKAQVVAKKNFGNAWQAYMMWLPTAILKGKIEVK